jgi:hypothetical protein
VLLAGTDAAADREAAQALQDMVLRLHDDSSMEPDFDALAINERPVILTMPLPSARSEEGSHRYGCRHGTVFGCGLLFDCFRGGSRLKAFRCRSSSIPCCRSAATISAGFVGMVPTIAWPAS